MSINLFFNSGRSSVVFDMPEDMPFSRALHTVAVERMRLSTEPLGMFELTLTNMAPGSRYEVETLAGALIEMDTVGSTGSVTVLVPTYAVTDEKNNLRIKVRKSSEAPYYQPFETQAVAVVGAQSIFINQLSDE
jgi:hypothetical protein